MSIRSNDNSGTFYVNDLTPIKPPLAYGIWKDKLMEIERKKCVDLAAFHRKFTLPADNGNIMAKISIKPAGVHYKKLKNSPSYKKTYAVGAQEDKYVRIVMYIRVGEEVNKAPQITKGNIYSSMWSKKEVNFMKKLYEDCLKTFHSMEVHEVNHSIAKREENAKRLLKRAGEVTPMISGRYVIANDSNSDQEVEEEEKDEEQKPEVNKKVKGKGKDSVVDEDDEEEQHAVHRHC